MSNARRVLDVRVHDVTYDESLDLICQYVQEGGPHIVTTPNPEIVIAAQGDPGYRNLLNHADLAIPDGVGLLWAARVNGLPFREHVRGTDLVMKLAERSARLGHRWFLLGAAPGVAERAASALVTLAPGLRIVGTYSGDASPSGDLEARQVIARVAPVHIILVAYGAPGQERWMQRNLGPTGVTVGLGVGGVFNYLAGVAPRAPAWMRRLELEWLHRLITQPWRWRRQLALPRFVLAVVYARLLRRQAVVVEETG